jgi:hypothetical protein
MRLISEIDLSSEDDYKQKAGVWQEQENVPPFSKQSCGS